MNLNPSSLCFIMPWYTINPILIQQPKAYAEELEEGEGFQQLVFQQGLEGSDWNVQDVTRVVVGLRGEYASTTK